MSTDGKCRAGNVLPRSGECKVCGAGPQDPCWEGIRKDAEEIERLRALVAQARLCLSSIDLSWLETFEHGPDGDYGGISLGDDHKTFWRDAIVFLETSGGRPPPPPRMTEGELIDALEAAYPSLPTHSRQDAE